MLSLSAQIPSIAYQIHASLINEFWQAIGHGISSSFLDKVREAAKHFFSLPMEEKHKCFRAVKEAEGYGSDLIVSDKQILDWSNRLFLMVFPENKRRLNLWPEMPNDFG